MSGLDLKKEPNMEDMKRSIEEAGGLFYQYRPCRRDMATIYDIENIRHGVVYAQTPLNMNDPFDSMIGFSPEKIYENAVSMIMDSIETDDKVKFIIGLLLKAKAFGTMEELLSEIGQLQKYFVVKQKEMHQAYKPFSDFIFNNWRTLYSKAPKKIKNKFGEKGFIALGTLVSRIGPDPVASEKDITSMLDIEKAMDMFQKKAEEIKDTIYVPILQTFLSQLTVSCFSASGWKNQLMWAHYANSYSGICVEYDFTKIDQYIGFIYPVTYTSERPTLTLQDLGIEKIDFNRDDKIVKGQYNITHILSYLLCKNTCWNYEAEWRIINIGEANKPRFVDMPYIKSITFGPHLDKICKRLLVELCQQNGIPCYDLNISKEKYELDRTLIKQTDLEYDVEEDIDYAVFLFQQINRMTEIINENSEKVEKGIESQQIDSMAFQALFEEFEDCLCDMYFIKTTLNRIAENSWTVHSDEKIPPEISDTIKKIEEFGLVMEKLVEQMPGIFVKMKVCGLINLSDFNKANNRIKKIKELNESIAKYAWHPIYQN